MTDKAEFSLLAENNDINFSVMPGDTVTLIFRDLTGQEHHLVTAMVDKAQTINTAKVLAFSNAFDLESGLIGVVGKRYAPPTIPPGGFIKQAATPTPEFLPCQDIDTLTPAKPELVF